MEARNLTGKCDWTGAENQSVPRTDEPPDAASCLFLSLLPSGHVVAALICVFVSLTFLSVLLNGLALFGLGHSRDLSWEPRVALFKNLISSDLIQTATFGPAVIHSLVWRRTMALSTWCFVQHFMGCITIFSSLVTITCMAVERYLYVCHAIHYVTIVTNARLQIALSLIWGYSISIGVTQMVLLQMASGQESQLVTNGLLCEPDMVEQNMGFPRAVAVFRKVTGSITLLVCLLIYAFCYLRMYQDARNAVIPFNVVNTMARKTVLFYCCMVILQLLPLLLKATSDALWEVEGNLAMTELSSHSQGAGGGRSTPSVKAAGLHVSLLVMLSVPPCINPLVYGLRSVEMRQALRSLCQRYKGRHAVDVRAAHGIRLREFVQHNRVQAG